MASFVFRRLLLRGRADGLRRAAGLLNLLNRRLRELVGLHRDLARQLARSQNLETVLEFVDDSQFDQTIGIERVAVKLFELIEVHNGEMLLENVLESALRQAAVKRHLAALETALLAETGDGMLALGAARGVFAHARAHAASHALAGLYLAGRWSDVAKIHC